MRKKRISVSVLVILILMIISSVALGILLKNWGVARIYCIIPLAIAAIYVVLVDKYFDS